MSWEAGCDKQQRDPQQQEGCKDGKEEYSSQCQCYAIAGRKRGIVQLEMVCPTIQSCQGLCIEHSRLDCLHVNSMEHCQGSNDCSSAATHENPGK